LKIVPGLKWIGLVPRTLPVELRPGLNAGEWMVVVVVVVVVVERMLAFLDQFASVFWGP
jgi:hypothetical protein